MAKSFSWDKETVIGEVEIGEKEIRKICICELNGKTFVSILKIVFVKGEWKIVSNATFPLNTFSQISSIVANHLTEEK